jgi:hypothetical protein
MQFTAVNLWDIHSRFKYTQHISPYYYDSEVRNASWYKYTAVVQENMHDSYKISKELIVNSACQICPLNPKTY